MGYADYGFTPNVWRPSEVPARFAGEDISVELTGGRTLTRNIGTPCTWQRFYTSSTEINITPGDGFWDLQVHPSAFLNVLYVQARPTSGIWRWELLDNVGTTMDYQDFQNFGFTFPQALIAYIAPVAGNYAGYNTYVFNHSATAQARWKAPPLHTYVWDDAYDPISGTIRVASKMTRQVGSGACLIYYREAWGCFCE